MMSDIVKLQEKDFNTVKELIKKRKIYCSSDNLKKSFDKHIRYGLKYDKKSGVVSDKEGFLSKYSYKDDILKNPTREEVIEWEFMGWIANSCSRIERGYKP